MAQARKARVIPGFSPEQSAALFREFNRRDQADESLADRDASAEIQTKSLTVRANQFVRCSPGTQGMGVLLPPPLRTVPGDRVVLSLEAPAGPLRVSVVPNQEEGGRVAAGTVNRQSRATYTVAGLIELVSNGDDNWQSATEHPAESAAISLTTIAAAQPTWAEVLARGRVTGNNDPLILPGRFIGFGATTDVFPSTGDARSVSAWSLVGLSDLTFDAGGDMHLHALGAIHVGHTGLTNEVHIEADGEIAEAAGANISHQAVTTITHTAGTSWTATAQAGDAQIQASADFRLITNGVSRLVVDSDGSWLIDATTGTVAQYLRSSGATGTPTWATIAIGELGAVAANTVICNPTAGSASPQALALATDNFLARLSGNIISHPFSTLAGAGLTYAAGALAVGAGTNVTVSANDVAVDNYPLSGLADQAANTIVANATGGVAPPTAFSIGQDHFPARVGANIISHPFSTLAGHSLDYASGIIDYVGNTAEITNATATGNLGTIDISSLSCGGSYRVTNASSSFSIEGFTAKPQGFWFVFSFEETGGSDACTLFHEDATATATNRLALPHEENTANARTLFGIFFYTGSRWRWLSCDPQRIGSSTVGVVATGTTVTMASTGDATVSSSAGDVALSGATQVTINGGSGGVIVTHDGGDRMRVLSDDATGGFIDIEEASSSGPASNAGRGMVWVLNLAPNQLQFNDDSGNDWPLNQHGLSSITANTTVTNNTTNISGGTYTIPANTSRVGSVYHYKGYMVTVRGATNTAVNVIVELLIGGAVRDTVTLGMVTTPLTKMMAIEAYVTVRTLGTPGSCMAQLSTLWGAPTVFGGVEGDSGTTATGAITTTANASLEVRARFSAAVANTTLTFTQGIWERVL